MWRRFRALRRPRSGSAIGSSTSSSATARSITAAAARSAGRVAGRRRKRSARRCPPACHARACAMSRSFRVTTAAPMSASRRRPRSPGARSMSASPTTATSPSPSPSSRSWTSPPTPTLPRKGGGTSGRTVSAAAYLASMGAARSGAGIVRLLVAQSIYPILAQKCTEVIVGPVPEISPGVVGHASLSAVLRGFTGAASGIVGPGIGRDTSTRRLIEDLLPKVTVPLVLDADALNLLSEHRSILPKLSPDIVLTPHPAEFGRLANLETSAVQKDRRGIASRFAKTWNKVVVLKGAGTVIAAPDGRITLNPIATPALASAGTGDVLAGLIGGLMAQKLPPFEAAVTGVHLHSVAGTDLEASMGQAGVLASDLLPQIPRVMERLR